MQQDTSQLTLGIMGILLYNFVSFGTSLCKITSTLPVTSHLEISYRKNVHEMFVTMFIFYFLSLSTHFCSGNTDVSWNLFSSHTFVCFSFGLKKNNNHKTPTFSYLSFKKTKNKNRICVWLPVLLYNMDSRSHHKVKTLSSKTPFRCRQSKTESLALFVV